MHINTPPFLHADQCVAALEAGKHAACTIPMALSVEDCKRIVDAQEASGKKYMMMETVVYSREYLYVKELYDKGEMGKLQFFRSSHVQDMGGWPTYWEGLPPMHNGTHAISPTLALGRDQAEYVTCAGSGTIEAHMHKQYGLQSCLTHDDAAVASGSEDGKVYVWDLVTGGMSVLTGHTRSVLGVAPHPREPLEPKSSPSKPSSWSSTGCSGAEALFLISLVCSST